MLPAPRPAGPPRATAFPGLRSTPRAAHASVRDRQEPETPPAGAGTRGWHGRPAANELLRPASTAPSAPTTRGRGPAAKRPSPTPRSRRGGGRDGASIQLLEHRLPPARGACAGLPLPPESVPRL